MVRSEDLTDTAMKKSKPDPAQLLLEFESAKDGLTAALEKLGSTMKALVESGAMKPQEAIKAAKKISKESDKELRLRIIRVVREHARSKKLHWKEIFRIAYRRLWDETGFNAAARAIAKGGKTKKIDVVEEHGLLPKLLNVVAAL